VRLSDLTDQTSDVLRQAGAYLDDLTTPTLRLGVTGLSRAGKTVFITALVNALTEHSAAPPIALLNLPGMHGFLEPQPDDALPRFNYEGHLADLTATPPQWPESTRHISQLRVTLAWHPSDWLRRQAGVPRRLHIDIIDYPGEWLADVGLLEQSFQDWSEHTARLAREAPAGPARDKWLAFADRAPAEGRQAEQVALEGARLFQAYLSEQKAAGRLQPSAGPGRFLMPGDYEGSPLVTFCPLAGRLSEADGLAALLTRRFESYKTAIVEPFFEQHFSRIERQIVLVDVLGALNQGPRAVVEMENALERALAAFRPGRQSWIGQLIRPRVDTILFAASKADHLNRQNHNRLAAILEKIVERAEARASGAGARIGFAAIAALRCTEDVTRAGTQGEDDLNCVRGTPVPGQTIDSQVLAIDRALTVFPGDLPADPLHAFDPDVIEPGSLSFVRFRPCLEIDADGAPSSAGPVAIRHWPHVNLERVIQLLIGDRLT
jgi:predicted YcjX-like family ATPase